MPTIPLPRCSRRNAVVSPQAGRGTAAGYLALAGADGAVRSAGSPALAGEPSPPGGTDGPTSAWPPAAAIAARRLARNVAGAACRRPPRHLPSGLVFDDVPAMPFVRNPRRSAGGRAVGGTGGWAPGPTPALTDVDSRKSPGDPETHPGTVVLGAGPRSRIRVQVRVRAPKAGATQHLSTAVPVPAVVRPLPQIAYHVEEAGIARRVAPDRAGSWLVPDAEEASHRAAGGTSVPFSAGRQVVLLLGLQRQPSQVRLRLVPAHARHGMPLGRRSTRVPPWAPPRAPARPATRLVTDIGYSLGEDAELSDSHLVTPEGDVGSGQGDHFRAVGAVLEDTSLRRR